MEASGIERGSAWTLKFSSVMVDISMEQVPTS